MSEKRIISDATEAAIVRTRLVDPRCIKQITLIATQDQPPVRGYKTEATLVVSAWAATNKDCYAVFRQLPEPPLTIQVGPGSGVDGLIQLATGQAKSLLATLPFKARAHLQFLSIPNYAPDRSGPKQFCLLTLCADDSDRSGSVLNNGKDPLIAEFDAAGNPLLEFRLETGAADVTDDELAAHLVRNRQMWEVWKSMGVTEQTHLPVDFHFYATSQKSAESFAEKLRSRGLKVSLQSKRMLLLLKGWEITASESTCWTLDRLQLRTRELSDEARLLNVRLEGTGALLPGPGK